MKTCALLIACLFGILIGTYTPTLAQCKETIPPQDPTLIEKRVLFDDAHHNKKFNEAVSHLNWLLINAPTLNTNLYIKGAEIFEGLLREEKDQRKKQMYFDSLIVIYDLRIKNCGDEANVTTRKAIAFFNHQQNGPKLAEVLPLMDRALDLNGDRILDGLLDNYMIAVQITVKKLNALTEEQIMQRYDKVTNIIDAKIQKAKAEGKPIDRYLKLQEDNLNILTTLISVNCEFVRRNFGPKFKETPNDINLAKKIYNFMLKDKCIDDPLWLEAIEAIYRVEKDFGIARILGMRYLTMGDLTRAGNFFKEALSLAKSSADKSEVLSLLGYLEEKKNNRTGARDLYLQALAADPKRKEVYEKIGDLYYNSYEDCAQKKHQANDRLVFLVAFDMYQKAGDEKKMANAKSSFPSMGEIHELNYSQGQKIKVNCWINEETTLRTRD